MFLLSLKRKNPFNLFASYCYVTFGLRFGFFITSHSWLALRIKGELGEFRFTLERYPCINKYFWWFQFFLIRLGCRDIWKNVQSETTKRFSLGNTKVNIIAFDCLFQEQNLFIFGKFHKTSFTKLALIGWNVNICFLGNQGELERTETTKSFCWCRGIFLKLNLVFT